MTSKIAIIVANNVELTCRYEFEKYEAAVLECGVQVEPAWPAHVTLNEVYVSGNDISYMLSTKFITAIEKQILEDLHQ